MLKLVVVLAVFMLAGCEASANEGINPSSPEDTVEVLQNLLGNEGIPEPELADMHWGLRESYTLDEDNFLFLNEDGDEIEQINLRSVTEEEARAALELIGFPEVGIFEDMFNYTEEEMEDDISTKEHFTNYEGVGVNLRVNQDVESPGGDFMLFDYEDPYHLMILFNEDRFDTFRE